MGFLQPHLRTIIEHLLRARHSSWWGDTWVDKAHTLPLGRLPPPYPSAGSLAPPGGKPTPYFGDPNSLPDLRPPFPVLSQPQPWVTSSPFILSVHCVLEGCRGRATRNTEILALGWQRGASQGRLRVWPTLPQPLFLG